MKKKILNTLNLSCSNIIIVYIKKREIFLKNKIRLNFTVYFNIAVFLINECIEIVIPNLLKIQYIITYNIQCAYKYAFKNDNFKWYIVVIYIKTNSTPISNESQFHQPPQLNSWLAQYPPNIKLNQLMFNIIFLTCIFLKLLNKIAIIELYNNNGWYINKLLWSAISSIEIKLYLNKKIKNIAK